MIRARQCPSSARMVEETIAFLRATAGCGGAMFYWVEPDLSTTAALVAGLPAALPEAYRQDGWRHDPLHTPRLASRQRRLAELEQEARHDPNHSAPYRRFLAEFGVAGNVEFLFWAGEGAMAQPWGGISLLPLDHDTPVAWGWIEATYRYVDLMMRGHAVARHAHAHAHLVQHVGLTRRECDLCDLVAVGASNADIAQVLGLTTATVKTYLRRVFDKMGVDSRTALAARLSGLGSA